MNMSQNFTNKSTDFINNNQAYRNEPTKQSMNTSFSTIFSPNNSGKCMHVFIEDYMESLSSLFLIGVLTFLFFFIIMSNSLLILGLQRTTKKLSLTKILFIYLSVTDMFTGLVTVPIQISMIILYTNASCLQVYLQAFFNAFTPTLAMFTLLSISVSRFVVVAKPNFYHKYIRNRYAVILLVFQFVLSIMLALWYVWETTEKRQTYMLGIFFIFAMGLCLVLIGAAVIVNIYLLFYLHKYNRKNMAARERKTNEYQTRVTKTILMISIVLVMTYLPTGVVFSISGFYIMKGGSLSKEVYNLYVPWAHMPMILNAGLNSFIYMLRNKKIVKYYKSMFFGEITYPQSQLPQIIPSVHNLLTIADQNKTESLTSVYDTSPKLSRAVHTS